MSKLKVNQLEMYYGEKCALDSISFEVMEGEFLSILGPSGCGKTTLLHILVGLLKPSGGTIWKDNVEITNTNPKDRGMGIVFQNYALFENMTAVQNVEYALLIRKENKNKNAKKEIHEKAKSLLSQFGLGECLNRKPRELSGGQQQRVAIARTLIMNPDILLFDEPMSALDIATRLALRKDLKRIQSEFGTTMIYITHDQEEAFAMSDRVMVMQNSKIAQLDKPEEILEHPANDYVREFVLDNLKVKFDSLKKFTCL